MKKHLYFWLARLGQRMSLGQIERVGNSLGTLIWHLFPSRRRTAVKAISERLAVSPAEAEQMAHQSFRHNSRAFLELFKVHEFNDAFFAERVTIQGREIVERIVDSGQPMVLVSGHMGAWEFMPMSASKVLHDAKITIPARQTRDKALHELLTWLRQTDTITIIPHRRAVGELLRSLRREGYAGFLVDHNTNRQEAIFLPFLGKLAAVNKGPALLAVRTKALVVPFTMLHQPDNRYLMIVNEPLDTATLPGERDEQVQATAEFYTRAMEDYVRAYPEQWFWMHKRWKTRPANEGRAESAATSHQKG